MVHIERIVEAAAKIVYGVVVASLLHDRQVILLIVEIHGNRSTVDIFWAPTSTKKQDSQKTQHKSNLFNKPSSYLPESHIRLERVISAHRRQLHRRHGVYNLAFKYLFSFIFVSS